MARTDPESILQFTCTLTPLSCTCTSLFPTCSCHFAQQVVGSSAARCAHETRCFVCSKSAAHPQCIDEFSGVCWNEHNCIDGEILFCRCIPNTVMTIELLVCPFLQEKFLLKNYRQSTFCFAMIKLKPVSTFWDWVIKIQLTTRLTTLKIWTLELQQK